MSETVSFSMTDQQWRQLILERIIELEARSRANLEVGKQILHYVTKADMAVLDKAVDNLVADYRKSTNNVVAMDIVRIKSEATE